MPNGGGCVLSWSVNLAARNARFNLHLHPPAWYDRAKIGIMWYGECIIVDCEYPYILKDSAVQEEWKILILARMTATSGTK
jgi:hypothetical protein